MKKWICKSCGYTHQGDEPPERCPKCGSPASGFYQDGKNKGCAFSVLFLISLLTAFCFNFLSCSREVTVDNSVVSNVNLNKYLGKWYEVARFDHKFERDMSLCTALYTLQENGIIKVTNQGVKDGRWRVSVGKAKPTNIPGLLRVSFFGPFYSDYRIMMLAPDYSYALVGGSSDKYLWILSRSPVLEKNIRDKIINEASRRGYKTDKFIWVDQKAHW